MKRRRNKKMIVLIIALTMIALVAVWFLIPWNISPGLQHAAIIGYLTAE